MCHWKNQHLLQNLGPETNPGTVVGLSFALFFKQHSFALRDFNPIQVNWTHSSVAWHSFWHSFAESVLLPHLFKSFPG